MAAIDCGTVKTTWKYGTSKQLGLTIVEPLGAGQSPGTLGNADYGKSCKRCAGGHSDRTARRDRQVLRFGTARSRS